jgi:ABC-type antimicrobial peptide transport system permease subunit
VTILGMLTTVVAVFYPVWKLSRVSPAEAIGAQKSLQSGTARAGRWRPVLFSISALLLLPVFPPFYGYHRLLNLAPIVGAIVLAPMLAAALLKYSRRAARLFPLAILQLAWGYAVDKPGRIESTIRGVVVGMLLIFVIASIQDGFMQALSSMFINSSRPDFYVSSNGDFISPMTLQPIDDRLQLELAKVAGVAGVFGQRIVNVQYESHKIKMSAFDEVPPSTLATPYSYFEVVDRPTALAGHEMYHSAAPSVMVSESFQSLYGKKTGDAISLRVLNRSIEFRIVGIVRDFTAGGGRIYIARNLYKSLWHDPLVTGIAIVLEKSALLGAVKAAIEERFGRSHGLVVTIDRGIKKDVEGILRQSFLSFYFIEFVCILVAVLGFVSAFLIEIQSRTVELATLRAIGMSRFELSLFLSTEAFLLGLGASLVTLVLAVPVSWGLISHTLPLVLGWVVEYHFAWRIWLLTFLLGIFIAVVSSLVAIRWARGLSLAEAGAGE